MGSSSLLDVVAKSAGVSPIVIFAEGAKSNGKGILTWPSGVEADLQTLAKEGRVAMAWIQYSTGGSYSPHHLVGSALYHLFASCMQLNQSARVTFLPEADVKGHAESPGLRTLFIRLAGSKLGTLVDNLQAEF